ncbi:MAG: histidine phosphatase family protein [Proteobacteria bacterium]|nr:histidine phosphatase family protein [Pseudomonadota bacterium]
MRRLLLLRHARTESDAPTGNDWDRRLTAHGNADAADIGQWLAGKPALLPDLALVSTAVRARATWDIIQQTIAAAAPHVRAVHLQDLYGAEPAQLLAIIRATAAEDPRRLMLVGHNPGFHEVALALIGGGDAAGRKALDDNMPTSGLAVIDFAVDDWDAVTFRSGQLAQFVSPKLLKDA